MSQAVDELPSSGSPDPGQLAEAVHLVLKQAQTAREMGEEEAAWTLVQTAAGASTALQNSLDQLDPDGGVGVHKAADDDADEDPGQLAQALDQVLDEALEEFKSGNDENGKALVTAAAAAVDALLEALNVADTDEAGDSVEKSELLKALMGTRKVGVPLPSRYDDQSPVPLMNPDEPHGFIGHSNKPGTCVACGKDLGHDNHWQQAPVYKAEEGDDGNAFQVVPGDDTPVWIEVEKAEGKLQGLVYGVVLHPQGHDAHGDRVLPDEIEKAAHGWMRKSRQLGNQHFLKAGADVVESYIAPVAFRVKRPDGQLATVPKGAWVAVTKVHDPKLLRDIAAGRKTGYSIGGSGIRDKEEGG